MAVLNKSNAPKILTNEEKTLGENDFIVSKTNTKGHITYCNRIFVRMSGYNSQDLIGANHNLIRHPDMPKIAFKIAWEYLQNQKEFFGFIKNLCADGGYYWVFAYITADTDEQGNTIGYTSFRRKPHELAIETIIPLYKQLTDIEKQKDINASSIALQNILNEKQMSYNEFIITLQGGHIR